MDPLRQWWQDVTADDDEPSPRVLGPAVIISIILHLALVVILGTIWTERQQSQILLVVSSEEPPPPDKVVEEFQHFRFNPQVDPHIGSPSIAGMEELVSRASIVSAKSQVRTEERPVLAATIVAPLDVEMASAPQFHENVLVKGAAGAGAVGALGAVDQITQEILMSLEQRKTLVVWMFDRSASMQAQREAVSKRLRRIYEELGQSDLVGADRKAQPLLTSVMAFGSDVSVLTPQPTDDLKQIEAAIDGIRNDESGVEMVFSAVVAAAQRYRSYKAEIPRRNVMLIIFTDEVGDDELRVDQAVEACRQCAMPVYVVGVPAPFGRREIEIRYVDPDPNYDQSEQWIPVRQGPETLFPETVKLGFRKRARRDDSLYRLDSGFGPYCLSRLCVETGGIYFAVHPDRAGQGGRVGAPGDVPLSTARFDRAFDPVIMHAYAPEYFPYKVAERAVLANKARVALVRASELSMVMPMAAPVLTFPKEDEASLKRLLDDAQKGAALLEPKINGLYELLRQGEVDRPRLAEPRQQASFDLALGRVLAVKVRTESYNAMLAKAKNGLKFERPDSNTFVLEPANEISIGSQLEKQATQARQLLERVVKEHAGTPWALLAALELEEPIGWRWGERNVPRPSPAAVAAAPAGGGGMATPRPPQLNRVQPKPRRLPKL